MSSLFKYPRSNRSGQNWSGQRAPVRPAKLAKKLQKRRENSSRWKNSRREIVGERSSPCEGSHFRGEETSRERSGTGDRERERGRRKSPSLPSTHACARKRKREGKGEKSPSPLPHARERTCAGERGDEREEEECRRERNGEREIGRRRERENGRMGERGERMSE